MSAFTVRARLRRRWGGSSLLSIKLAIKQVFLSQRNKEEKSSPQSRQVVALRAKFSQILARSAKILALRALDHSSLSHCTTNRSNHRSARRISAWAALYLRRLSAVTRRSLGSSFLTQMNANRSEVARTLGVATNIRFRSAEGIYKAKAKPWFDSDSPVSTDLFAYICTYLRTFALKTFFLPSREVPGSHQSKQVNYSASRKFSV